MMKHLLPATVLAVCGTLAAAFAVLWAPSLGGKVITGAALAVVAAWWLGKHRHARRGAEAGLCGAALATALIVLLPDAVPAVVGLVMIAPAAAHELNPKRKRVARTTRGVRTPAAKAAGGRAGRPGEAAHKPRANRAAPAPRTPAPRPAPKPRAPRVPAPSMPPEPPEFTRWPYAGPRSSATFLPWAGEGSAPALDTPPGPRPVSRRPGRPGATARAICGECLTGCCPDCKDKGCECPGGPHDLRPGAPRTAAPAPAIDPDDVPPY